MAIELKQNNLKPLISRAACVISVSVLLLTGLQMGYSNPTFFC